MTDDEITTIWEGRQGEDAPRGFPREFATRGVRYRGAEYGILVAPMGDDDFLWTISIRTADGHYVHWHGDKTVAFCEASEEEAFAAAEQAIIQKGEDEPEDE
jgi:hypothetical protein